MIKFVHKKHAEKAKGTAKIIITYSFMEIVLGLILLITNITGMILIYQYTIQPQVQSFSGTAYSGSNPINSRLNR